MAPDRSLLLPHDEFAFAELKREGKEQTLRLVFSIHEVLVRGHSLRRIETAMQRLELTFLVVTDDNWYGFVGRTSVKYIPVNETVEMELGYDREVLVKPTLMSWEKTNIQFDNQSDVKDWTFKETWQVEVQNSKDIEVVLDVRRNFAGDWSLKTDASYEKVDANKVKFVLPLKPREKRQFSYDVTTQFGVNVTR